MADVRWGILGCGRIARIMARAIDAAKGARLAAVASRQAAKAQAFAAEHGAEAWFGDYDALARSHDIDIVYVATPPARHLEDCRLVLEQGKHVLCEKPLVAGGQDAAPLVELARRNNLFLMEAMWTRFLPATEKLLEIVSDPRVGAIRLLIAGGAFKPAVDTGYFLFRPELGGGVMNDAGVYLLHLAHWLLGPPQGVAAQLSFNACGVDDHDAVLLGYANEAQALIYVSMRASQAPCAEILCENARIRIGAPIFNPSSIELTIENHEPQIWRFDSCGDNYHYQIEEVVSCLRRGVHTSLLMPPEHSLAVSRVLSDIVGAADERSSARP